MHMNQISVSPVVCQLFPNFILLENVCTGTTDALYLGFLIIKMTAMGIGLAPVSYYTELPHTEKYNAESVIISISIIFIFLNITYFWEMFCLKSRSHRYIFKINATLSEIHTFVSVA